MLNIPAPQSSRQAKAFTLVELLVVIGIIALLISILLPSLNKARQQAGKVKCAANIRSMVQASMMRAQDNPRSPVLLPTNAAGGNSLGFIIPQYIRDPQIAICPGTRNFITKDDYFTPTNTSAYLYGSTTVPKDVVVGSTNAESRGHSYEPLGWYSIGTYPDGRIIDGRKVGSYRSKLGLVSDKDPRWNYGLPGNNLNYNNDITKKQGKLLVPANKTLLFVDRDDDTTLPATPFSDTNNWPDARNNHGKEGTNIGFADGHVEFIRPGLELARTWMEGLQDIAIYKQNFWDVRAPGVKYSTVSIDAFDVPKWELLRN